MKRVTVEPLGDFFEARVREAARMQDAGLGERSTRYLASVLVEAAAPGHGLPEQTFVELRAAAVTSPPEEAPRRWRALGEGALLVAGCFSEALNRRNVNRTYCAAMGASAFGVLSAIGGSNGDRAVFADVSARFDACADVLAQAAARGPDDDALLRLWQAWAATASPRLAACLRARGVVLSVSASA